MSNCNFFTFLLCSVLCVQALNAEDNERILETITLGSILPVSQQVQLPGYDTCYLNTPNGAVFEVFPHSNITTEGVTAGYSSSLIGVCTVNFDSTLEDFAGTWALTVNLHNNNGVTSVRQPFIFTTTALNAEDNERILETITVQVTLGSALPVSQQVQLPGYNTCYLNTPNGTVFEVFPHSNIDIEGVTAGYSSSLIGVCTVNFDSAVKEFAGTWSLTANLHNSNGVNSVQQPFIFSITVPVLISPSTDILVHQGEDLYVRFEEDIDDLKSCNLTRVGTGNETKSEIIRDSLYYESCGFAIQNVDHELAGEWQIVAVGALDFIKFVGNFKIAVDEPNHNLTSEINLTIGDSENLTFGPEDALFCEAVRPSGLIAFSGAGQCSVIIDSVDASVAGIWKVTVGFEGRLTTVQYEYRITVNAEEMIEGTVTENASENVAYLTCSLRTAANLNFCTFTRPDGTVFAATEGLGSGRYSYHNVIVPEDEEEVSRINCGIAITTPAEVDFGTWRCTLDTSDGSHTESLALRVAETVQEQVSSSNDVGGDDNIANVPSNSVFAIAGKPFTLSCSISSSIEYCWFSSPHGKLYSALPETNNTEFFYSGVGLAAGDCSLTFRRAEFSQHGPWHCNLGLHNSIDARNTIEVDVRQSALVADNPVVLAQSPIVLTSRTFDGRSIHYCRFVRPDGVGFNTESPVEGYSFGATELAAGVCSVVVHEPRARDVGRWVTAALIQGDTEEAQETIHVNSHHGYVRWSPMSWLLVRLAVYMSLVMLIMAIMFRGWKSKEVIRRVSSIRNSFIKKKTNIDYSKNTNGIA